MNMFTCYRYETEIREVGNGRTMSITGLWNSFSPFFPICQLLSKGTIMNKIIKIISSVMYWEGLPEIGHRDLGFSHC